MQCPDNSKIKRIKEMQEKALLESIQSTPRINDYSRSNLSKNFHERQKIEVHTRLYQDRIDLNQKKSELRRQVEEDFR